MKNKKVLALALAATMALAPVTSYAAEWQGPNGNGIDNDGAGVTDEMAEYGHTTFSIIEAQQNPNNVSFEVPLYVTMAAMDGETELAVPNNYSIVNTSAKVTDEDVTPFNIAVVGLDFTKLENATYSTVETLGNSSAKNMVFTIGEVTMPAINAVENAEEVTVKADLTVGTNKFYDKETGKYTAILADGTELGLPLTANLEVAPAFNSTKGAVAQFKVTYTVSALDGSGDLVGAVYAGDDQVTAGLAGQSSSAE